MKQETMKDIKTEITELVAMIVEKEAKEIAPEAHLVNDIGADSMMALEILASIEKKYKIVIPEDKLREMTTVNRIAELTEGAMKKK